MIGQHHRSMRETLKSSLYVTPCIYVIILFLLTPIKNKKNHLGPRGHAATIEGDINFICGFAALRPCGLAATWQRHKNFEIDTLLDLPHPWNQTICK